MYNKVHGSENHSGRSDIVVARPPNVQEDGEMMVPESDVRGPKKMT